MVRVVGIEPTLLSEPDFESGASTSSTTPAHFCRSSSIWSKGTAGWDITAKRNEVNCSKVQLAPLFGKKSGSAGCNDV